MVRSITLELDETDYNAIERAIAMRQNFRVMPEGLGNLAGRTIAEICRGWMEFLDRGCDEDQAGEEWKRS